MQKIIFFFATLMVFAACQDDKDKVNPNTVNLNALQGTHTVSPLEAKIYNNRNEEVLEVADLQPDHEYKIVLKGEGTDFIRIKNGHVFEVIEQPTVASGEETTYRIKTGTDFADRLYLNVVPLHKSGDTFIREKSQAVFLPF
jgi:hypothetical protein